MSGVNEMNCPYCGKKSHVNRTVDLDWSVERNRRCPICGKYFDTVEIPVDDYKRYERLARYRA